jgi:crossover junction endodeoxyribonuclease RusA
LEVITLTLSFPPKDLNPNTHVHRMVKAAAAKNYRHECKTDALNARNRKSITLQAPIRATVTFCCGSKLWDLDNLVAAFKPAMDGIVESGLIPNDSPTVLHVDYRVVGGPKRNVTVTLEEAR